MRGRARVGAREPAEPGCGGLWSGAAPRPGTGAGLLAEVRLGAAPCAPAPAGSGAGARRRPRCPASACPRPRPLPARPPRSVLFGASAGLRAPASLGVPAAPGFLSGKEQPARPGPAGPERARGRQPRSGAQLPGPEAPAASPEVRFPGERRLSRTCAASGPVVSPFAPVGGRGASRPVPAPQPSGSLHGVRGEAAGASGDRVAAQGPGRGEAASWAAFRPGTRALTGACPDAPLGGPRRAVDIQWLGGRKVGGAWSGGRVGAAPCHAGRA